MRHLYLEDRKPLEDNAVLIFNTLYNHKPRPNTSELVEEAVKIAIDIKTKINAAFDESQEKYGPKFMKNPIGQPRPIAGY